VTPPRNSCASSVGDGCAQPWQKVMTVPATDVTSLAVGGVLSAVHGRIRPENEPIKAGLFGPTTGKRFHQPVAAAASKRGAAAASKGFDKAGTDDLQ